MHTVFTLVLLFCKTLVQQRHDVHDKFQGTGCPACCRALSHRCRGAVMLMSPDNCPQAALPEVLLPWGSGTRWLDPLGQFPHLEIWSQVISLARPVPPVACPWEALGITSHSPSTGTKSRSRVPQHGQHCRTPVCALLGGRHVEPGTRELGLLHISARAAWLFPPCRFYVSLSRPDHAVKYPAGHPEGFRQPVC